MPDDNKDRSLIESGEQLELISSADMDDQMFAEAESRGEHTGVRLWHKDPGKYQVIMSLLAEGVGQLRIADLVKSSVHTVRAVARREGAAIEKERAALAQDMRAAAKLCVEAILEMVEDPERRAKMSGKELGVLTGILSERSELLSGRATSRVEVARDPDVADFQRMLDRAREEAQSNGFGQDNSDAKRADVIECEAVDRADGGGEDAGEAGTDASGPDAGTDADGGGDDAGGPDGQD